MSSVRALRERLGDSGMAGLEEVVSDAGKQWKDDVLAVAAERFETRLGAEVGALRVDMAKEFAAMRTDMAKECASVRMDMAEEFAAIRTEMATLRFDLLKWCFAFWIAQVATITAIGSFLLRPLR